MPLSVCFSISLQLSSPTGLFFISWLFSATQPNKVKCLRCFSVPCDCAIRSRTAYPGGLPAAERLAPAFPLSRSLWLFSGPAFLHHLVRSFVRTTVGLCTGTLSTERPKPQPCRPAERLRPGARRGSGTLASTDFAGLCVGEAAGKPAGGAAALWLRGCGLCRSWFVPRASVPGWRWDITPPLPSSRWKGTIQTNYTSGPFGLGRNSPSAVPSPEVHFLKQTQLLLLGQGPERTCEQGWALSSVCPRTVRGASLHAPPVPRRRWYI